mgnify:CR=1 FL=1
MPQLSERPFKNSVVYICQHDHQGAMGLIINKAVDTRLAEILQHLEISFDGSVTDYPLFSGGPVQPEHGFVIHTPLGDWRTSMPVTDQIAVTTSKDILAAMVAGEGPEDVMVTLGYSGWDPGQLEQEIQEHCWITCQADLNVLFHVPAYDRWQTAAALAGIKNPLQLTLYGGNA